LGPLVAVVVGVATPSSHVLHPLRSAPGNPPRVAERHRTHSFSSAPRNIDALLSLKETVMSGKLLRVLALILVAAPSTATAQDRLRFELRGGAAFPTAKLGN